LNEEWQLALREGQIENQEQGATTMTRFRMARWAASIALAVAVLVPGGARAQGVQTSASLQVIPDTAVNIVNNQLVQVTVLATNTSSDLAKVSLPATIGGPITVTFGCTDCACMAVNNTNLVFVPGGAMGCDSKAADVTSCAAMGTNEVLINLDANGIDVPVAPGNQVEIARFTLRAVNIDPNAPPPTLGIRAMTGVCSVQACNAGACVQCAAEGCSRLNFGGTTLLNCPHLCPNKIIFKQNGPDFIEYHAIINVPIGWDPNSTGFQFKLVNSDPTTLFDFMLPPGSFLVGTDTYTFQDANAQNVGGIAFIKAAKRDNQAINAYRIDIQAYSGNLQTGTTNPDRPNMTTTFSIGGLTFTTTETWTRKNFGWQLNKH
jgi:hypothetical protein